MRYRQAGRGWTFFFSWTKCYRQAGTEKHFSIDFNVSDKNSTTRLSWFSKNSLYFFRVFFYIGGCLQAAVLVNGIIDEEMKAGIPAERIMIGQ